VATVRGGVGAEAGSLEGERDVSKYSTMTHKGALARAPLFANCMTEWFNRV
jgi:hypothetical protein